MSYPSLAKHNLPRNDQLALVRGRREGRKKEGGGGRGGRKRREEEGGRRKKEKGQEMSHPGETTISATKKAVS
jgi:hypothetical protein